MKWNDEKSEYLKSNYGKLPLVRIADHLDVSIKTVQNYSESLGLGGGVKRRWTKPDVAYLVANYSLLSTRLLSKKMRRTEMAICRKAKSLKLRKVISDKMPICADEKEYNPFVEREKEKERYLAIVKKIEELEAVYIQTFDSKLLQQIYALGAKVEAYEIREKLHKRKPDSAA